jgi:hypothetical protein
VILMAVNEAGEIKILAATNASASVNFEKSVISVYIKTDANIWIAFDRAATTNDFLLEANDRVVEFNVNCTQVHIIANTTANVYLVGRR